MTKTLYLRNAIRLTALVLIGVGLGEYTNPFLGIGIGLLLTQVSL